MGLSGWWAARCERRLSDQATDNLQQFLIRLKGLGPEEWALAAAQTADICGRLRLQGIDLLEPQIALQQWPTLEHHFSKAVLVLQEKGEEARAPGFMVWAHTLRAEQRIELLYLAKEMWGYVARGFSGAELSAIEFRLLTGHELRVSMDCLKIPKGFESVDHF